MRSPDVAKSSATSQENSTTNRITIRDVAREAGVSVATVSRVLAEKDVVRGVTRKRVQEAVERLNFQINPHARALAGGGSRTIGFLVRDVFGPSFASLARGVETEAADRGHLFLMSTTRGDADREATLVAMMRVQGTAAVILVGGVHLDEAYEDLLAHYADTLGTSGSRLVLCGRPPLLGRPDVISVQYDNVAAGRLVTEHLVQLGHRRILFVTADDQSTNQERLEGYRGALTAAGIEPDDELVLREPFSSTQGAERLVTEALAAGIEFTALVGVTGVVAIASIRALRRAGLSVPGDISVTGINDEEIASDFDPGLTTVRIPFEEVGRITAALALTQPLPDDVHRMLPVELIVRGSTAKR